MRCTSSLTGMTAKPHSMTVSQIYMESSIMDIMYDGEVETKPHGQNKIGGTRPTFSTMHGQIEYGKGTGRLWSFPMGRECTPNQPAMFLDFGNKGTGDVTNGWKLAKQLNMDQYEAPKQYTPSSGLHYIFYDDGEQAKLRESITRITLKGTNYAMDVKSENGLCNCQPSKIKR